MGAHEHVSFRGSIKRLKDGQWTSVQLAPLGFESAFPYAISVRANGEVIAILTGTSVRAALKIKGNMPDQLNMVLPSAPRVIAIQDEKIWVAGNGLKNIADPTAIVVPLPDGMPGVLAIAIDHKGNKWLGTAGGGVAIYHDRP